MKIEVITLHNVKNYGSLLQTYATQTTLEELGHEVEFIDYERKDLREDDALKNRVNSSKVFSQNWITKAIGYVILRGSIEKQKRIFREFLNNHIHLTKKRYYSNEELKKECPKADIYMCGSDQVWNSTWNQGFEYPFFLDFVPEGKTKVAYSSSFGKTEIPEEEKAETKRMLNKYKAISVRESTALNILEDLDIDNGVHVLDPTLMLNKEKWDKITGEMKHKGKYILVYQLNSKNDEFDKYVKNLSKAKKLPVIRLSYVRHQALKYGKLICCPRLEEFLAYFMNAEYIVTDSFHGTAFAINLNKKFLTIYPNRFSTRLESILKLTNLMDRHVEDYNEFNTIDKEIDYTSVNKILDGEREKTLDFLKQAIKA